MTGPLPPRVAFLRHGGANHCAVVTEAGIVSLSGSLNVPDLDHAVRHDMLDDLIDAAADKPPDWQFDEVVFLPPLSHPGKILCIGVNFPDRNEEYKDHQAAAPFPSIFVRFPQSFVGHEQDLARPPESPQLDYEGEIAIVIGKLGRRIALEQAYDHIAALTLCNEGTIRDWVRHAKFNVTQGKNWDRSGAIGPWLVPFHNACQLDDIELRTLVNGQLRQIDRTSRMIFGFRQIINYISTFTTLMPGDIIICGTPTGAGARLDPPVWLKPGDRIDVEAQGIGRLSNGVTDE